MDLSAYSRRDIDHCRSLLEQATAAGLDLPGLLALVQPRFVGGGRGQHLPQSGRPCPTLRPDGTPCPGRLAPVANREGLRILGCRLCRYSEVVP